MIYASNIFHKAGEGLDADDLEKLARFKDILRAGLKEGSIASDALIIWHEYGGESKTSRKPGVHQDRIADFVSGEDESGRRGELSKVDAGRLSAVAATQRIPTAARRIPTAADNTERFQKALAVRLTASSLDSVDQAQGDETSMTLLAAAYAAQPKEFIGKFFSFHFTGIDRNVIVRFTEARGTVYAEFYTRAGYKGAPPRSLGRVLVDAGFIEQAKASAASIVSSGVPRAAITPLLTVAANMDKILFDDVVRMARTALRTARQISSGTGSETAVYNQTLDIDLRLEVPADFSEARKDIYRQWVERIQSAFRGEGRISVQFAEAGQPFTEVPGAAIINSGVLSDTLLESAAGHGISAVSAGSFDESSASFIPRTIFAVLVQRLNRPTDSLQNLWANIRSNPMTELTPEAFAALKTVRSGSKAQDYRHLAVKAVRIAWNQVVNAARMALQAVGSAA